MTILSFGTTNSIATLVQYCSMFPVPTSADVYVVGSLLVCQLGPACQNESAVASSPAYTNEPATPASGSSDLDVARAAPVVFAKYSS